MSYTFRHNGPYQPRLPSGLSFRADPEGEAVGHPLPPGLDSIHNRAVSLSRATTEDAKQLYFPLLEVSVEVKVVATISRTRLTQMFTNKAAHPIKEATYCFPLYDGSTVTGFSCVIGSNRVMKGVVKPRSIAKAEFKEAVTRQRAAALLEEHTPEVFEASIGNIPAQTTVKVEIHYITELKPDVTGDGILITIPTSVAPRYGTPPGGISNSLASNSLAVPPEDGLRIQIKASLPVPISRIESSTHPVSVEMGSHGYTVAKNIKDLAKKHEEQSFDPKKARATLSDRTACLGRDFVLLIQARDGKLLASRALIEPHPTVPNRSAMMLSMNLKDFYTPNIIAATESRRYCPMWLQSRPYNQANVDSALAHVAGEFAADLGGTELLNALREVVRNRSLHKKLEIITLTDGQVWNSPDIFSFIQETRSLKQENEVRFFCLGIGHAVSHHLVEGIGQYGGGLAQVVQIDTSGDWMRKMVAMLGAALTPSSWGVEVIINDVSVSDKKGNGALFIQAPNQMPEIHTFARSSVFFMFNDELEIKSVKIRATAMTSGEVITGEVPIEQFEIGQSCVHLLTAKKILHDLEGGQSWLHDAVIDNNAKKDAYDVASSEGEKISAEWSISSKYASFIIVDDFKLTEAPSFLYKARKLSSLSDLTRSRYTQSPTQSQNNISGWFRAVPDCGRPTPGSYTPPQRQSSRECAEYVSSADRISNMLRDTGVGGVDDISISSLSSAVPSLVRSPPPLQDAQKLHSTVTLKSDTPVRAKQKPTISLSVKKITSKWMTKLSSKKEPSKSSRDSILLSPIASLFSSPTLEASGPGEVRLDKLPRLPLAKERISHSPHQEEDASTESSLSHLPLSGEITLDTLVDSQTAAGNFRLQLPIRELLLSKFKHDTKNIVDDCYSLIVSEGIKLRDEDMDTAIAVAYIEGTFIADVELWRLVVQKAIQWLDNSLHEKKHREQLLQALRDGLLNAPLYAEAQAG
ncbi:vault protein inter-alpha-trypsin domain-containing protein [Xylogone sp. PMI_703]|nr:vault protein inter-alpha-trypsin domain-containing protein [Xylogone sp. PMI_703]